MNTNDSSTAENKVLADDATKNNKTQTPQKRTMVKVILCIVVVLGILLYVSGRPPANFPSGGIITVTPGESFKEISTNLTAGGYIRSSFLFTDFVIIFGGEKHLSPGDYYFAKPISVFSVAWQIANGYHYLDPVKITIPEGRTVSEISDILKMKLPAFDQDGFKKNATQYEGFLFPETYFVYPHTDALTVIDEMRNMYTKEAKPVIAKDDTIGKSERDVVIMASLIEKEAKGNDDRAIISGILWNRIAMQIPLQVDATVAYAKGISENSLQKSDMGFDSPYNTYIYRGLPPGPISNPGLLALEAAMNPAQTDYLYYLHDKYGNIHYAKTYAEHQANINQFLR